MHEPEVFFGGEIVAWEGEALVEVETPEQIKARRILEKERKKHPGQSCLFSEGEQLLQKYPELKPPTTEELINDLPF